MNEGNHRRWREDRWDEFADKTHPSFDWELRHHPSDPDSPVLTYVRDDGPYHMAQPFEPGQSFVYFIHAPELKRVKIGISTNVPARLSQLKNASPCQLRLLKLIPGDRSLEERIHDRFRKHRLSGEWFDEEVLDLWAREGATSVT